MSDARSQVTQALDSLVAQGWVAAALAGRDGLPVLLRAGRPVQEATFCAMGAALLAAGEAALQELAEVRPAVAFVEAGDLRLGVASIDENHLLVAAAPAKLGVEAMRAALQASRDRLRTVLGG